MKLKKESSYKRVEKKYFSPREVNRVSRVPAFRIPIRYKSDKKGSLSRGALIPWQKRMRFKAMDRERDRMQCGTVEHKTFLVYRSAGGCLQTRALQMGGPVHAALGSRRGNARHCPSAVLWNRTEPNHAKRPAPTGSTSTKEALSRWTTYTLPTGLH